MTLSLVYFSKNADEFHRIEVVVIKRMRNFATEVISSIAFLEKSSYPLFEFIFYDFLDQFEALKRTNNDVAMKA